MAEPRRDQLMVMSIRPRHVEDILAGRKTVELRRTRPSVSPGQAVAIYATTPCSALVATCLIREIEAAAPEDLWDSVGASSSISRNEFDDYFSGSLVAHAMHLVEVKPLDSRVVLSELRAGGFTPPQTWHFFDRVRIEAMLPEHPAKASIVSLLPRPQHEIEDSLTLEAWARELATMAARLLRR